MATDREIFNLIVASVGYKTTVGPIDKSKVQRAINGQPTLAPSSKLGLAAWYLAKRIAGNPPPPPPPPPPPTVRVAPKVTNKQGGSDADFCCENQPGVMRQADGTWKDDVARYDANGLHLGGRSDAVTQEWTEGLRGARERDGIPPCQLPTVGDAAKNTGSWQV